MGNQAQVLDVGRRIAARARACIPEELLRVSGRALYSPVDTLVSGSPYYFLGLNPGEVPGATEYHSVLTVEADLDRLAQNSIDQHGYLDEQWKGNPAGCAPMQKRGQQVFSILAGRGVAEGIALLRRTPTSNMVLHRATSAETLAQISGSDPFKLALQYWPLHQAVIEATQCKIIITHAVTVARPLARHWGLGDGQVRPSGWGGSLDSLYAWQLKSGQMLLAIPNLARYAPDGARTDALRAFFSEFVPGLKG